MRRLRISQLQPNQIFDQSLFTLQGQKLLQSGTPLSPRHIEAIQRYGECELLMADSLEELVEAGVVESLDGTKLKVGQKAEGGVISRTGQVLVEPGEEVEDHHLDAIKAGGSAFASRDKQANLRRERITLGDSLVENLQRKIITRDLRVPTGGDVSWIRPRDPREWPNITALTQTREKAVDTLRQLYARIEAGLDVPVELFDPILEQLTQQLSQHPARFTQLALLTPRREDYLPDHAYTVTVLGMSIAAALHWPVEDVRRLGLAGLLYDLGMLLVPVRIRTGAEELTDIDRSRVQRHPVFSLAMLQSVSDVPKSVQIAALQHHERENGTGYPHGLRKDQISDYARVLAAADTFAATTEPRHYRKPKLPYIAMEETLRSASAMVFWKPAVRALVQAAGLFPVGSYVKLSSSKNAHVIAANPKELDRPLIQPLNVEGQPEGEPIDLAALPKEELAVVRPIPGPTG